MQLLPQGCKRNRDWLSMLGVRKSGQAVTVGCKNQDKLLQLVVRESDSALSAIDVRDFGSAVTAKYKECESTVTSGFIENLDQLSRLSVRET